MKVREYKNGNVVVIVRPAGEIGLGTIFDKNIWIYAISKLQEAINNNQPIRRSVAFTPYVLLMIFLLRLIELKVVVRAYEDLKKALSRLSATRIQTNIIYSDNDKKLLILD